tara:strand:- start:480 stop:824 length:345 start_codon:yes stop_codon:yes gene_type:complete
VPLLRKEKKDMAKIIVQSINIKSDGYDPSVLDIPVGEHVEWTNEDNQTRTVTSIDGLFESGEIKHDDTFLHTFNEEGSFSYYSRLGSSPRGIAISGTINVKPSETKSKLENQKK